MTDALQEEFDDLIEIIRTASDGMAQGKVPDLQELETRVTKLVTDITKAGAEVAQSMKGQMAEMIMRLDELAQEIMNYQNKIENPDG